MMPHRKASHYEEIQMKRYTGQFTGWNPGYIAFVPDTADVDTINRIRSGRAAPIDMRGHMKLRAATIADWCIVTSMQKST